VTGKYLFPTHRYCNLMLKPRVTRRCILPAGNKSKRIKRKDMRMSKSDYFIVVVIHNLRHYDAHLILKHFKRAYAEYKKPKQAEPTSDDSDVSYDSDCSESSEEYYSDAHVEDTDTEIEPTSSEDDADDDDDETTETELRRIQVIPLNSEQYMAFQIGNIRFIDSFQFLTASLDTLVKNLAESGHDSFVNTRKHMPTSDLIFAKGHFPYSYMTGPEKMTETQLPDILAFRNDLTDTDMTLEDYDVAKRAWVEFGCQTMKDYHDFYLKLDTLLLADVFQNFRSEAMKSHGLDPAHYWSLPGFSWSACLKRSEASLGLITDPDMHVFVESGIRGGLSQISHRYAKAERHEDGDQTFIALFDANNLYAYSMMQHLPYSGFKWLEDLDEFDFTKIPDDAEVGYIIECDLVYPQHLHDLHNDYPLAPEKLTVTEDMLSPYCRNFGNKFIPTEKLVPNLMKKTKYITHYRNLKMYVELGMSCTKIHRVLSFAQKPWMSDYIKDNTIRRMMATTTFQKDLQKLKNNSIFGKTMENVRNRCSVHLVVDEKRARALVARANCIDWSVVNEDLVLISMRPLTVKLTKPIAVGFSVLELSKTLMYDFHYNHVMKKYGQDRARLLFTDTDSLCYSIKTKDMYREMLADMHLYDTSDYPTSHFLHSNKNKKVVGKFKDEFNGTPIVEFVGLRPKMYSIVSENKGKMTAKGVKKSFVANNVRHEMFLEALRSKRCTYATFKRFQSVTHQVYTIEQSKVALSSFDDKRYVLDDGFTTLAYGHYKIPDGDDEQPSEKRNRVD